MRHFFLLLICLASPVGAQGVNLATDPFSETVSPTSRVSGDIVMGVMLSQDAPSDRPPSVVTATPPRGAGEGAERRVCVRLVSKDGRYVAENTYVVAGGHAGATALYPYEGKQSDFLAPRAVATLVTTGACGTRSGAVLPALWKAPEAAPDRLYVYLNAAGNPASVAVGRGEFFEPCTDVTELTGLKYTARCEVPLTALPADRSARLTFFVTRPNAEESFAIEVLPVVAGG